MEQIFNSLKALITPELLSVASRKLEESESKISATIPSIFAGLLGVLLKKGNSPQLKNLLSEAGNLDILSNVDAICKEEPTQDQQRISDDFLQHLLGDKAADFTNTIATDKGISKVATNRLISIVAPLITGFLGSKIKNDGWSMSSLFNYIGAEKDLIMNFIPSGLKKSFGFSLPTIEKTVHHPEKKVKNNNNWIKWLLALLFLGLIFFWWRSCKNQPEKIHEEVAATTIVPSNEETTTLPAATAEITLPNGIVLKNATTDGIEDKIIKFLESDKYKKASNEDLKKVWFNFDQIEFEFGSTTKLKEGYQGQLNNIIAILGHYKDAKIAIGAYADKKGSEKTNKKISQERADTIESLLKKGGVTSQIIKAEGYGESFAQHLEGESDNARSDDRHIALRFVK